MSPIAIFEGVPESHAVVSLVEASAISGGVFVLGRDAATSREIGIERIGPSKCPTQTGMPSATTAYAMKVFTELGLYH